MKTKKTTPTTRRRSLADEIIAGLREFDSALKSGEALEQRLTRRNAELLSVAAKYDGRAIRAIRDSLGLSQSLFAAFLGVSPKTVRGWEQGTVTPGGMAIRFFEEIRNDRAYWRRRVDALATAK